ncbi:MAG: redox-sensitive transcriptional activator SoxR [Hyphomonadaceae bacterium]|nr:redox-sensitive transcriptional activator SoxR [Hyphomonadaceae bacterium]
MEENAVAPVTITIGELAARTGMSVSALRFHEARGLLAPHRTSGNQRRYLRSDIRRVSFILIAQNLGMSVAEISTALASLPHGRTPTPADWAAISTQLKQRLDAAIARLTRTRDVLDGCIGCGCLSLTHCGLYNRDDRAGITGPGPRYALGDPVATEAGDA